jgi:hypothetical protein
MNPRPKGKIGRLPKALREEVNRRLDDNEKGRSIIVWLNSLPQVRHPKNRPNRFACEKNHKFELAGIWNDGYATAAPVCRCFRFIF